jgi:hypothetical protein
MSSCAVPNCKNSGRKGSSMFKLPKNPESAIKWREFLIKVGAKKINEYTRICEAHFSFHENGSRSEFPTIVEANKVKLVKL